jgi:hypothetical protein
MASQISIVGRTLALLCVILVGGRASSANGATDSAEPAPSAFPEEYVEHNASTGADVTWKRFYNFADVNHNRPDPGYKFTQSPDGPALIYTTAGPSMKPGTEMSPSAFVRAQIRQELVPSGQPGTPSAYYAMLLKRGEDFSLLPMNLDPKSPTQISPIGVPWFLSSQHDPFGKKYLLFRAGVSFKSASWDKTLPSWEHFDAWWLDTEHATLEHVVLPPGLWVSDAKKDDLLLRDTRNFSCGTDCYRSYDIKVDSGSILVEIAGRSSAISEKVLGTYRLAAGASSWTKIKDGQPEVEK